MGETGAIDLAFDESAVKAAPLAPDEQALAEDIQRALAQYGKDAIRAVQTGATPDAEALREALTSALQRYGHARFLAWAEETLDQARVGLDMAYAAERAQAWLETYVANAAQTLTDATARRIAGAIQIARLTPNYTLTQLAALFEPIIGRRRAETIAKTELTRASAAATQASKEYLAGYGIESIEVWRTANDDRTCPICAPRNGKRRGDGWDEPPPAHAACRCFLTLDLLLGRRRA